MDLIVYHIITALLVMINLLLVISRFEGKKIHYYIVFVNILMLISSVGFLALSVSDDLSEAILAKKIGYIGGCFVPLVVMLIIFAAFNYEVNRWIVKALSIYSFIVYMMVLTIGYNGFYYTEVSLEIHKGATVLEYEYGYGHAFFSVIIYGYLIAQILFLVRSIRKNKLASHKNIWALMILTIINIVAYVLSARLDFKFEIMPLLYVIDGWVLLYLHKRIMIYNIDDCVANSIENQDVYGYIIFDKKKRYIGSDDTAKKIMPSLLECRVDHPIDEALQLECVIKWIDNYCEGKEQDNYFEADKKHYQIKVRDMYFREKSFGYVVELQEDTDKWNYYHLLTNYNAELERQVEEKTLHISNIQNQILVGMANIVENRDDNTGGHIKRTSDVIKILMDTIKRERLLALSEQFYQDVIKAAPMHDLGKIAIDDKILRKPGKLTDEEFDVMKTHVIRSEEMVNSILIGVEEEHFIKVAVNIARSHHEKWNGSGYPDGLSGEAIPLEARIMAIADVYDALVSKRCYKEPMSFEKAFAVMMESMGSHFDPKLEVVFLKSREQLEEYYSKN